MRRGLVSVAAARRHRLGALAATVAAAAVVSGAGATIVPQKGIAGVPLGMKQSNVRAKLGAPGRIERGNNDFGPFQIYHYKALTISFQSGSTVTGIATTRRSERTARGAGVGSREADLRRRVHGLRCRTEFGFRHCFLGRFLPGRRVTDFTIRRGRVSRVTIGFVLD